MMPRVPEQINPPKQMPNTGGGETSQAQPPARPAQAPATISTQPLEATPAVVPNLPPESNETKAPPF
jgi:hypothetical protein